MTPSKPGATAQDAITWLSQHPMVLDHVQAVGDTLSGPVLQRIRAVLPPFELNAAADHLWCDLLTTYARNVNETGLSPDIPQKAASTVCTDRQVDARRYLPEATIRFIADITWDELREGLGFFSQPDALITALRVLAILMCPGTDRHQAVQELLNGALAAGQYQEQP